MIISCSDNSSGSEEINDIVGAGSFSVSGDLEAQHEGAAYFTLTKMNGNVVGIRIHIAEAHPTDRDDSYNPSYTLLFMADNGGDPFSLSPTTYEVGQLSDDNLTFAGLYTHRIDADEVVGFNSRNYSGTLTISSYSDEIMEAVFEFTAENDIGETEGDEVITLSGEFTAKCFGVTC
ncbi:MAG: hypothetical protein WD511_02260 [Balneolaceae bacterium]